MKKLYLITFDKEFPRQQFLNAINGDSRFGAWFYSMPNSMFVYSTVSSNDIFNLIKEKFGDQYRFFVAEIDENKCQGWMPEKHWSIIHTGGAEKIFKFEFRGYYLDASKLPEAAGVFCVYRCKYCAEKSQVEIIERLLVGGAPNLRSHFSNSDNLVACNSCCSNGEQLCFTWAKVPDVDFLWGRDSLLHVAKARCNTENIERFPYNDTYVITSGANIGLETNMLIERK